MLDVVLVGPLDDEEDEEEEEEELVLVLVTEPVPELELVNVPSEEVAPSLSVPLPVLVEVSLPLPLELPPLLLLLDPLLTPPIAYTKYASVPPHISCLYPKQYALQLSLFETDPEGFSSPQKHLLWLYNAKYCDPEHVCAHAPLD